MDPPSPEKWQVPKRVLLVPHPPSSLSPVNLLGSVRQWLSLSKPVAICGHNPELCCSLSMWSSYKFPAKNTESTLSSHLHLVDVSLKQQFTVSVSDINRRWMGLCLMDIVIVLPVISRWLFGVWNNLLWCLVCSVVEMLYLYFIHVYLLCLDCRLDLKKSPWAVENDEEHLYLFFFSHFTDFQF